MVKDEKLDDNIFELEEKVDITGQTEHLNAQRPIWLPSPRFVIEDSIKRLVEIIIELGTIGNLPKVQLAYVQA